MIATLFLIFSITILSSLIITYLIVHFIRTKKRKQLNNELLPTITKPDVQSLFSKSKDKKKKERQIVFFKSTPKNYGEYLQQTGKQIWNKK
jgi:hypothetical protein